MPAQSPLAVALAALLLAAAPARGEEPAGAAAAADAPAPRERPTDPDAAPDDPHAGLTPSIVGLRPITSVFQHLYDGPFGPCAGVAFDATRREVYAVDAAGVVAILDEEGVPRFAFGRRLVTEPFRAVADRRGRVYVLDLDRSRVKVFNYRGEYQRDLAVPGLEPGAKPMFTALALDGDGNLYVGDSASGQVIALDESGALKLRFGRRGSDFGAFQAIAGIAIANREIYVTDRQVVPVQVFDTRGNFLRGWGAHDMGAQNFSLPGGVAVDGKGRVLVVDGLRHEIKVFLPDGRFVDRFGGMGDRPGEVTFPADIATDGAGRVFVAEKGGKRLQILEEVEGWRNAEGVVVDPAADLARRGH